MFVKLDRPMSYKATNVEEGSEHQEELEIQFDNENGNARLISRVKKVLNLSYFWPKSGRYVRIHVMSNSMTHMHFVYLNAGDKMLMLHSTLICHMLLSTYDKNRT